MHRIAWRIITGDPALVQDCASIALAAFARALHRRE
jgi:hypothetical protein